ncbi:primosomal replication protein N [Thiobacter aerophilum]|uniref:Primosomal replication protein N n=1 Tax=Thiobacter aerophilum TaxID=3121275 RepID=A0ABV0EBT0_9BURK
MTSNRTRISGRIADKDSLRHTPAGVPVLTFTLVHRSEQPAGVGKRKVECVIPAVAFEALAETIARWPRDAQVEVEGYLARKSRTEAQLTLYVQTIELTE